jgi:hypothetical protein
MNAGPAAEGTPRVLILSQHYWPESFRINEIAESLREAGCEDCAESERRRW